VPIKLDDAWLADVGLADLPATAAAELRCHVIEELEWRVGNALASELSDAQLDEFESLDRDEDRALAFLEENLPAYKDVVATQFSRMSAEIRRGAARILDALSVAAGEGAA
jgi:hypothetical protein